MTTPDPRPSDPLPAVSLPAVSRPAVSRPASRREAPTAALARRWRERRVAAAQLRELTRYAGAPLVTGTVGVHLVAGAAPVAFLVGTGLALGSVAAGDGPGAWLVVAALAFLVQQLLAPVQLVLSRRVQRRVDAACLERLSSFALTGASLAGLERPEVADRLSQADEAFEQWTLTPGAAVEGALALTARYTQLVGALVVLVVAAGPWAALAGGLVALVARLGQTEAFHRWGQVIRSLQPGRRRASYVRELATGTRAAKEIRTLGLVDWLDQRYVTENRAVLDRLWSERRRVYGAPFLAYTLAALVGSVVALLVVARADVSVAAVSLAVQALILCGRFGVIFPESDVKLVYGRSAWEALLELEDIARRSGPEPAAGCTRERVVPEEGVRLADVRFAYRPGHDVLAGLDLDLPVGTSTALIGVNGAGKTTLVKVLTGMYTPDQGSVLVDGRDLRTLDVDAWQRAFAITFQDYLRYELPLRENVAMAAIAHRDDDAGLIAEIERVGLGGLLAELPAGLDTPLTRALPGGRDLSGGQWQRLALARSLFAVRHGARVLVLDEPTAQLDARGEAEFYDTFLDLTRGVTSLVISHRFSTVRRADRIVVLDGGRVAELGTHDELVAAGGQYARMFDVQARRFGADDPPEPPPHGSAGSTAPVGSLGSVGSSGSGRSAQPAQPAAPTEAAAAPGTAVDAGARTEVAR
ncbi:ABC transporter related protein [Cellulomonas gilvus ATCC 13127]|uniref:ABC transporter related protein n=1 Tax=Cellulomonas gilvus (strain ATCC 13127 / NRRL B-14078) TaxID=593907 RepID=F8A6L1_CELGA|nr:ABC transporter related protein [Cellulomonas gilvus ATCC 13127]